MGINDRAQLAEAERRVPGEAARRGDGAKARRWSRRRRCSSPHDTKLGRDVVIEPNVVFGPGVSVGDDVTIRSLLPYRRGDDRVAARSSGRSRGFRPGAKIGEGAHIGNFVEIKAAEVEEGAKINHLAYIGDAHVGAKTNIGAGTITCNYDGVNKHRTEIGAGAFIGSNSALVAPVTIGDGAYVASGSVITEDVPADALAFGRARQVNKPGRAPKGKK